MTRLRCSVVVATYNRAHLLERLLASLEQQDLAADEFEVIVVDDGSTDDTQALLRAATPSFSLRVFSQVNSGPAGARNLAITNALSDTIVTLDDDVMPKSDLLRRHLELQESQPRTAAMGVMVLPPNKRLNAWLEWEAVTLEKQYAAMLRGDWAATPRQFYTANASFKKEDAINAGLFDTTFRRAEDVELAYRMGDIGVSFQFLPDAVIYHEPNRTFEDWLRVPWQYGHYDHLMWQRGRAVILQKARHDFTMRKGVLRATARLLVGRKALMNGFIEGAASLALLSDRAGFRRPCRALYSAIFNLQYWQGFCESTGGRAAFWDCFVGPEQKLERRDADTRSEASPPAV